MKVEGESGTGQGDRDADVGYEEPSKEAEKMDNWVPSCFTL